MRIAFVVLVHKNPEQVERLIKKMAHPAFDFYVHVDAKNQIADFESLAKLDGVFLVKNRVNVRWGGYNIVEAILQSIQQAFDAVREYDFVSVISGQDYPLVSNNALYSFFQAHPGRNFLQFEEPPGPWWKHAITRIQLYHLTNLGFPGKYKVQWVINKLLPRRKFPFSYKLYGGPGGGWWTLSTDCARYVLDFINQNRRFRRFVHFTWAPDEFLVHTIVMNSPYSKFVENNNLYYMDWSESEFHPTTLKTADFETLQASGKLLARKFDITLDSQILDLLDRTTVL